MIPTASEVIYEEAIYPNGMSSEAVEIQERRLHVCQDTNLRKVMSIEFVELEQQKYSRSAVTLRGKRVQIPIA